MEGHQEEKDENIMSQLQTRLKHLAMDVGERELRLSRSKAMYLKESREYKNSRHRRASGRGSFVGPDEGPYPLTGSYSSYSPWADKRYAKGDTKYTTSWGGPIRGRPKVTPWGKSPTPQPLAVPKWKYRIPDNELKKMSNIPDKEWGICWNFNSAKGCPRGVYCKWRHEKYSSAVNHPITREPLKAGTLKRLTTARPTTTLKPLQSETLGSENKSEEDKTGWPAEAAKAAVYTTNAKTRDTDTDSKEEKSSATNFGYNGNEPPGTGSEQGSGVE